MLLFLKTQTGRMGAARSSARSMRASVFAPWEGTWRRRTVAERLLPEGLLEWSARGHSPLRLPGGEDDQREMNHSAGRGTFKLLRTCAD